MATIELDGWTVDEETGEIIESPEGDQDLTRIAWQMADAKEQVKQWERTVFFYARILLARQEERRADYDGVIVSVRQSIRKVLDVPRFVRDLPELTAHEQGQIIAAATGFREELLPEIVAALAVGCSEARPSKPYLVVEKARKRAPLGEDT